MIKIKTIDFLEKTKERIDGIIDGIVVMGEGRNKDCTRLSKQTKKC